MSNSLTQIKGVSANGSAYDSSKKVKISQVYTGMKQPKKRYYPTVRGNAIPQQGVPYETFQKTLLSPDSKNNDMLRSENDA